MWERARYLSFLYLVVSNYEERRGSYLLCSRYHLMEGAGQGSFQLSPGLYRGQILISGISGRLGQGSKKIFLPADLQ